MLDRAGGRPISPSPRFESALRLAAVAHHGQVRKGGDVPYVEHPMAVALILDRAGFDEEVAIAGLLHDVVEDTTTSLDQVRDQFGDRVAGIVAACSEQKLDADGQERPWADRKRDHLAAIASADVEARAVILADKLHNLLSIQLDLLRGRPVWDLFHADRASVLNQYRAMIVACDKGEPRLRPLADACREALMLVSAPAEQADQESGEKVSTDGLIEPGCSPILIVSDESSHASIGIVSYENVVRRARALPHL